MKNETDALKKAIIELQEKRHNELESIKENFDATYESLKPINLIRSSIDKATSSSKIKGFLLRNAIGLTAGFLFKKLVVGRSHNPLKILFGAMIQVGITTVVSGNAKSIKSTGEAVLNRFLNHGKESEKELHYNGNDILI